VARYVACIFYIRIPFNEDLYWTDIQRTVSFYWHQNSHSKLTWAPPISTHPSHINHGLRHPTSSHIEGLNHGDSVVLPPPTISLSAVNAVEAVTCLLHRVGKSEGDDATRHDDNHLTSNTVSIIHPPLVPRPYPNAHKLSRGTNTKSIRLIWFFLWQ
jgi:hypothetical protein